MDQVFRDESDSGAVVISSERPAAECRRRDFSVFLAKGYNDDVQTVADQSASKNIMICSDFKISNDNEDGKDNKNDFVLSHTKSTSRIVQMKNSTSQFLPEKFSENPFRVVVSDSEVEKYKKQTSTNEFNIHNNKNDVHMSESILKRTSPKHNVSNELIIEDLLDLSSTGEVNDDVQIESFTPRITFNYFNDHISVSEADIHVEYIEQLKSKYYDSMEDALQIDIKNCVTPEQPSPTTFRKNRIFPIDELSERSNKSVASNLSLLGEREHAAQLQRIKIASTNCSQNRPVSRKPNTQSQTKLAWEVQRDSKHSLKTDSIDIIEYQETSMNSSFSSLSKNESVQPNSKLPKNEKKKKAYKPSFHLLLNEKLIFDDETQTESDRENSIFSSHKTFSTISEHNIPTSSHPTINCSCFSYMVSVICSKKKRNQSQIRQKLKNNYK